MRGYLSRVHTSIAALAAVLSFSIAVHAQADDAKLVQPGSLTVAFTGDMPGSGWQDGKLIDQHQCRSGQALTELDLKLTLRGCTELDQVKMYNSHRRQPYNVFRGRTAVPHILCCLCGLKSN